MCVMGASWQRLLRLALLIVAALLSGSHPAWAIDRALIETTGKMSVRVVDSSGAAISGAKIHASIWTKETFQKNRHYVCDDEGRVTVELPRTLEILRVWASKPDYAPMFAQVWPRSVEGETLAKEFEFSLAEATSMGGVARDETGAPIEGVRVEVSYQSGGVAAREQLAGYNMWLATEEDARITDAAGRWLVENVPPGDDVKVSLKFAHPSFVSDQDWGELQREQTIESKDLRNRSAVVVMRRGSALEGKVTDPTGAPVKDAVVIWGDDPSFADGSQEVLTDADGTYSIPSLKRGPLRITVAAPGWMPEMRKIDVGSPGVDADFSLRPGKKLRIKFVDAAGKPLPKVGVQLQRWRGAESLYNQHDRTDRDLQIPVRANGEGIFEWSWAPDDAVDYVFSHEGSANTEASLAANDQEQQVVLHPLLRIAGTVSGATTGKPIDKFRVVPVIHFRPDFPFLNREDALDGADGKFEMVFDRTDIEHGVQIEARGYRTFRTDRRYVVGEASPALEVKLEPCERYEGQVIDAQGRAVKDARVYLATGFQHLTLLNSIDANEEFSPSYRVDADADGEFEIVPQRDRYALVVVSPDGFAMAERKADELPGTVRVGAWAKVDGHVAQAGVPISGTEVFLEPISFVGGDEPRLDLRLSTVTDKDGKFSFDRVPPIACRVRPFVHFSVETPLKSSRSIPLSVAPGSHTTLELGSGGAEITGKLVLDRPIEPFDFHFSISFLVAKRPGIEPPAALADKGFDWRRGWSDSWRNSQEGQAYLNTLENWFVKPDPDGRFRISGVPPGEYDLALNLYGTTEGCLVHPIAQRVMAVNVPAGQATVQLGEVVVPTHAVPQVGDQAADFEFVAPGGKQTSLAEQHGKYVLVDFWATWCGPCVASLDHTDGLRMRYGSSGLIVVGANLDADADTAQEFLAKKPLPWHHAFLGDWSSTDLPKRYGISSVPSYVLVDPDGRIAVVDYSIDAIAEFLESHVGQK